MSDFDRYVESRYGPGSADMARRRAGHEPTGQPLPDPCPGVSGPGGNAPLQEKGVVPPESWHRQP